MVAHDAAQMYVSPVHGLRSTVYGSRLYGVWLRVHGVWPVLRLFGLLRDFANIPCMMIQRSLRYGIPQGQEGVSAGKAIVGHNWDENPL